MGEAMTEKSDLERVLAVLDERDIGSHCMHFDAQGTAGANCPACNKASAGRCAMADAARLLREMAADFANHTFHAEDCAANDKGDEWCSCGLDAARARWRLQ